MCGAYRNQTTHASVNMERAVAVGDLPPPPPSPHSHPPSIMTGATLAEIERERETVSDHSALTNAPTSNGHNQQTDRSLVARHSLGHYNNFSFGNQLMWFYVGHIAVFVCVCVRARGAASNRSRRRRKRRQRRSGVSRSPPASQASFGWQTASEMRSTTAAA